MIQPYYSYGKFLLTGEYLVLKGALALALPLKLGQSLQVSLADTDTHRLHWIAQQPDKLWFSVLFDSDTLQIISTDDPIKAEKLASILTFVTVWVFGNEFGINLVDNSYLPWYGAIAAVIILVGIIIAYLSTAITVRRYIAKN